MATFWTQPNSTGFPWRQFVYGWNGTVWMRIKIGSETSLNRLWSIGWTMAHYFPLKVNQMDHLPFKEEEKRREESLVLFKNSRTQLLTCIFLQKDILFCQYRLPFPQDNWIDHRSQALIPHNLKLNFSQEKPESKKWFLAIVSMSWTIPNWCHGPRDQESTYIC